MTLFNHLTYYIVSITYVSRPNFELNYTEFRVKERRRIVKVSPENNVNMTTSTEWSSKIKLTRPHLGKDP